LTAIIRFTVLLTDYVAYVEFSFMKDHPGNHLHTDGFLDDIPQRRGKPMSNTSHNSIRDALSGLKEASTRLAETMVGQEPSGHMKESIRHAILAATSSICAGSAETGKYPSWRSE
jgi:hypothetical protein